MREIKFRAWNKKQRIMCYDDEDNSSDYLDGINISDIGFINHKLSLPEEDSGAFRNNYEVMQYTGLKDMNDVEIYEGDIYDNGWKKYLVEYSEERAGFFPFAKDDGCGCCSDELVSYPENGEIVGNIYENKHLLEQDN